MSPGFSCNEGEKKHVFYDDHLNSEVTVCRKLIKSKSNRVCEIPQVPFAFEFESESPNDN